MDGEMKRNIEQAEEQLSQVRAAAQEGLDNLERLENQLSAEGGWVKAELEQTNDYLRGDVYELEQRLGRASDTVASLTNDVEEIYDPEPA